MKRHEKTAKKPKKITCLIFCSLVVNFMCKTKFYILKNGILFGVLWQTEKQT